MIRLVHRSLLVLRGADATPLMQGLITNDVRVLEAGKPVAAFLLNIKGRIVEDLILWQRNQDLLIECSTKTRDDLKKTLEKYRMRKKVDIIASDEPVSFSTESGDFQDPRLSSLGFRSFGKDGNENVDTYHRRRRELGIAEGSEEIAGLLPFQCNGDILNMISLDKGCYIGQELTARTAHTGVIRKRIIPFNYDSNDELDNIVVDENKKKAGQIISYHDGVGLALLSVNSINMNLFSKTTQIQQFRPSWMSSKHLRRLLEEKEQEKYCKPEEESSEVEDEGPPPQMNRFAFLEDDSESEKHESEDETPEAVTKKITPEKPTGKQKNKKKRKSQRKVDESEDEDVLLDKLAKENAEVTQQSTSGEFFFNSLEPVFKVDPKKFDPRAELKAALGKAFKEASSTQAKGKNTTKIAGRIVKCGRAWPLVRNIGLSMVPVNDEKTEFKYVFNKHYEMLERMALMGERSMDIATAQEILHSEHWHLHSLLLLANACLMQDDITLAMDYVERGIFFCEQNFHSLYDYTNLNVSIKYSVYENRAYYLLLHKYMLMSIQKRCFETALNFAKLICSLDIQNDPLAMFLVLDTLAIKAKQYTWLNMLCRAYSENRKMNLLPNFSYSKALSAFLTATNAEQKEDANILLEDAIHKFPGVITHLIEVLQIQADATVENNSFLNIFAFNREHEGFQLVVKIYIHQSQELWKAPEVLLWLEEVSRKVATESNDANGKVAHKMDTWKEKRSKMFIGIPEEVSRLSVLLGVSNGAMSVTDPFPPSGTVNRYLQEAQIEFADENILAGFLNSMLPDYDPTIPLIERLQSLAGDGLLSRVTEFLRPHQNTAANADNANNGENNQ